MAKRNPQQRIMHQLDRIEGKLDTLIQALAEYEEDDEPVTDLDGNIAATERDPTESLG